MCKSEVIIIGAGAAGIAASSKLIENGITNITILEATANIGGRICSVNFGEGVCDLGAEWCHGETCNLIFEMVNEFDVLKRNQIGDCLLICSDGTVLNGTEIGRDFLEFIRNYECFDEFDKSQDDQKLTIADYCLKQYKKNVLQKHKASKKNYSILLDAIDTLESHINVLEGSQSWHDTSIFTEYESCKGDQTLTWKHSGYKLVLDIMTKAYPNKSNALPVKEKILHHKEVVKILWKNKSNTVEVVCKDGAVFFGNHVIFTPSLGVLKSRSCELFVPELPQTKLEAIKNLGYGSVVKVFLYFPDKWWDDEVKNVSFIWRQGDKNRLMHEFPHGPVRGGTSWLTNFYFLISYKNNPNVLSVWFTGKMVNQIETISDDLLLDGTMFAIRKFFGKKYKITTPTKIIRSSWYSDKNFLGTYSYTTVRSQYMDFNANEELSKPLLNLNGIPTLLFAGEATSKLHFSTVHGAIESGYREADRIVEFFKTL